MIRVLHILPRLCDDGPSRVISMLSRHLDSRGISVQVASLSEPTRSYEHLPTVSIGVDSVFDLRTLGRLRKTMGELRPDIVHTHMVRADWYGRVAAKLAHVRAITTTVHNEDDATYIAEYGRAACAVVEMVNRLTALLADGMIVVSEGVRRYVVERQHGDSATLTTIVNGVDVDRFAPLADRDAIRDLCGFPHNTIVFGTAAALKPQKGLKDYIEAAAILSRKRPESRFVVAGAGPQEAELRRRIGELGLADVFRLIGHSTDIPRFLSGIDVFVLPSMWEGMPLALLEAMAAARPVIVTDIGGSREAVADGVEGLIVPRADPERLASALETMCAMTEEQRAAYGAAARKRMEWKFSWRAVAEEYARFYGRLMEAKS